MSPAEDRCVEPSSQDVTELLSKWSQGDRTALDALTPLIYDLLRDLAKRHFRQERPAPTLLTANNRRLSAAAT